MIHHTPRAKELEDKEKAIQRELKNLNLQGKHRNNRYNQLCRELQQVQSELYTR